MAKLGARTIAQSVAIGASCGLLDVVDLVGLVPGPESSSLRQSGSVAA
jgi:hypothetical protein